MKKLMLSEHHPGWVVAPMQKPTLGLGVELVKISAGKN
jgi:hypothetical protein